MEHRGQRPANRGPWVSRGRAEPGKRQPETPSLPVPEAWEPVMAPGLRRAPLKGKCTVGGSSWHVPVTANTAWQVADAQQMQLDGCRPGFEYEYLWACARRYKSTDTRAATRYIRSASVHETLQSTCVIYVLYIHTGFYIYTGYVYNFERNLKQFLRKIYTE